MKEEVPAALWTFVRLWNKIPLHYFGALELHDVSDIHNTQKYTNQQLSYKLLILLKQVHYLQTQ